MSVLCSATSLTPSEVVKQLRYGPSASREADAKLMDDAADLIETYWDKFQEEGRANIALCELLAEARGRA